MFSPQMLMVAQLNKHFRNGQNYSFDYCEKSKQIDSQAKCIEVYDKIFNFFRFKIFHKVFKHAGTHPLFKNKTKQKDLQTQKRPPMYPLGIACLFLLPHLPEFSVYLYSAYFYTFATQVFIQKPIYSLILNVHIMLSFSTCSRSLLLTVV